MNSRCLGIIDMQKTLSNTLERKNDARAFVNRRFSKQKLVNVCQLNDKSDGVTSPRYVGRLLMYSIHIIESNLSKERAQQLLTDQIPLLLIMQEAYNVADDTQRDILRKLRYLMLCKKTDSDNDNIPGRLEAFGMIIQDPYSLLV